MGQVSVHGQDVFALGAPESRPQGAAIPSFSLLDQNCTHGTAYLFRTVARMIVHNDNLVLAAKISQHLMHLG